MENPILSDTEWGITDVEIGGKTFHLGCADPSNIWKMNGYYYVQIGNLCALNKYGKIENPDPYYTSGWTELFRSKDLKNWEFVHRFYENNLSGPDWPDSHEDDMCPSFLPLYDSPENGKFTGKYLQLFISHIKGCQYFIGDMQGEKFIPKIHGRMTWRDSHFFAPESLVDDKNRHIMWVWFRESPSNKFFNEYGWEGLYSSPRMLWLQDNELKMAPVTELEELQCNHQQFDVETRKLPLKNGKTCRIKAEFSNDCDKCGFKVRISEDGKEYTEICLDKAIGKLVMDTTNSGNGDYNIKEEAPFVLKENEKLQLDILIDNSVIEVYANDRQAIGRCVFPTDPETATGVEIIGDLTCLERVEAWEMKAISIK